MTYLYEVCLHDLSRQSCSHLTISVPVHLFIAQTILTLDVVTLELLWVPFWDCRIVRVYWSLWIVCSFWLSEVSWYTETVRAEIACARDVIILTCSFVSERDAFVLRFRIVFMKHAVRVLRRRMASVHLEISLEIWTRCKPWSILEKMSQNFINCILIIIIKCVYGYLRWNA